MVENTGTECLDDVEAPNEKEKRFRNCHDGELLLVLYAVTMETSVERGYC